MSHHHDPGRAASARGGTRKRKAKRPAELTAPDGTAKDVVAWIAAPKTNAKRAERAAVAGAAEQARADGPRKTVLDAVAKHSTVAA